MNRRATVVAVLVALSPVAHAEDQVTPKVITDVYPFRAPGPFMLDGGLVVGFPTALPTGMAKGIGAGVTFGACPLRWGARAAWVTAQESSTAWTVRHSDLRVRLTGSAQYDAGRGSLALRLGVGGTLVHETRDRNQGMRAGLTGDELQTTALRMVPAADLEAVLALHVLGPWLLTVSGGPTAAIHDGGLHGGWIAELGVAWAP